MEEQIAWVVCEGPCNGQNVEIFDEAVASRAAQHMPMSLASLEHARTLLHTPHRFIRKDYVADHLHRDCIWGCERCGMERIYGRESA